ncbi:M16 family metallopeptidase [Fontivita pretiosa]|uniref:M16 family metallopeptidase n=1 Tax=Fontivita pretiosa TaxID=2989684 RepID=UPI003D180CA7
MKVNVDGRDGARRAFACILCFWLSALCSVIECSAQSATAEATTRPGDGGAESYRIVSAPDEVISVLENGLTVIVKRVSSPVTSVRVYVRTGGIYEGRWLGGGVSHLLEHLVAGGSNDRRGEAENRDLLQAIGNNSNAYTTYDHTCYFINTTAEHLDKALDLVAGWVLGARITPAEFAREHQVVQRELEMNRGQPDSVMWKLVQANRYHISPARVPVIGYQQVIQRLSRDDVYNYYRLAYQPNNMVVSVAGDLEPAAMLSAVQAQFGQVSAGHVFDHDIPAEPAVLAPRTVVASFPDLGQARLDLSFPTIRLDHPDLYALDLLATILGTGESSILVQELRDRRKLVSAVSVGSYTPGFVDGSFSIYVETDAQMIEAVKSAVLEQLERLKASPIEPDRISRAKAQVRMQRVREMQKSEQIAAALATDWISTGDPHFQDRYVERIQAVTASQLQEVARRYLDAGRLLTTALIPAEAAGARGLPAAEELLRQAAGTTQPSERAANASDKITRVELDGGLILLHKRFMTTPLVEVQMYALGGLTVEDAQTNGLGNLAMQMLPRGTESRTAAQIASFFDSIGSSINTACNNNTWSWQTTCLSQDLPKVMEVFADIVNNPTFPESELPAVKQRILADIQSQDADWYHQAMRFFRQQYFGPMNSPYQFLPVGRAEVVQSATRQQLQQWYQTRIRPSRKVLAIFGNVDLETASALARANLARASAPGPGTVPKPPSVANRAEHAADSAPEPSVNVTRVEVQKTQQPIAGIIIGFKSDLVIGEPAFFALTVIDTITSGYGYPTGYLFEILRGRGLVYDVHALNFPGRDASLPGTFFVGAGCDPDKVNDVIDLILQNIARCQGTPQDIRPDWFERSRQLIKTGEAMENETPAQQAQTAALDELYGLGYDYHERFAERIDAVNIEQVRQIARQRLSQCVITVSTPKPELVKQSPGVRVYRDFPPVELAPRETAHDAADR